jgi:hypothetical protein
LFSLKFLWSFSGNGILLRLTFSCVFIIKSVCHFSNQLTIESHLQPYDQMPPSTPIRQPKRKREAEGESPEEQCGSPQKNTPQEAGESEYVTCPCGSRIKRKGFQRHTLAKKHWDHWFSQNSWKDNAQHRDVLLHKAALAEMGIVQNYWHL